MEHDKLHKLINYEILAFLLIKNLLSSFPLVYLFSSSLSFLFCKGYLAALIETLNFKSTQNTFATV